jgi:hypothetical protein
MEFRRRDEGDTRSSRDAQLGLGAAAGGEVVAAAVQDQAGTTPRTTRNIMILDHK